MISKKRLLPSKECFPSNIEWNYYNELECLDVRIQFFHLPQPGLALFWKQERKYMMKKKYGSKIQKPTKRYSVNTKRSPNQNSKIRWKIKKEDGKLYPEALGKVEEFLWFGFLGPSSIHSVTITRDQHESPS